MTSISNFLLDAMEQYADKLAIYFNEKSYTYRSLNSLSNTIAGFLQKQNWYNERIAFMLPNGTAILALYLACFKTQNIAVPINRRYATPELARVLTTARPKMLVVENAKLDLLNGLALSDYGIEIACSDGPNPSEKYVDFHTILNGNFNFKPIKLEQEDRALIFFTSGSTGEPKGVVHCHRSIQAVLDSTAVALECPTEKDIILVQEPQCHVSGFMETFTILSRGGTAIVADNFQIDLFFNLVKRFQPTLMVPHIDTLIKLLDSGQCTRQAFFSFRGIYTGGDELPSDVQKRFVALSGKPIQLGYGMTEAIWLTICRKALPEHGCIGKPVAHVQIQLINKDGELAKLNQEGEIRIKGPMVMKEYWQNEKATQDAFVNGWFCSGDCAKQDASGHYWFTGRMKNIIIRNTSNIMPGEVEDALYKHPDVKSVAVIGVRDEKEGQVPIAFVVLKHPGPTEESLKEFAKQYIAQYKVPKYIYFIDKMPLTVSGKIDHKQLAQRAPH